MKVDFFRVDEIGAAWTLITENKGNFTTTLKNNRIIKSRTYLQDFLQLGGYIYFQLVKEKENAS